MGLERFGVEGLCPGDGPVWERDRFFGVSLGSVFWDLPAIGARAGLAGESLEVEATGAGAIAFLVPKMEKNAVGAGRFGAVLDEGVPAEEVFEVVVD